MSEPLQVEASLADGSVCLTLTGDLTFGTVPVLDEQVDRALGTTRARMVLDVHGLQFCDSVGLSALIGAQRRVDLAGGRLVLRGVHGRLERVLQITGARALFTVVGGDPVDAGPAPGDPDRADELA